MAADQITLTAATGRTLGTRPSKRLRAEGKVPAVVYGADTEPVSIAVEWADLRAALTTDAGLNAIITLDVDGDQKLTIIKDMQRHPVRRDITHVDFIVIDRNKTLDVDVPVLLVGGDANSLSGLVIDQQIHSLPVSAKPDAIPNEFVVDISGLTVDSPIRAGDLELPAGVELNLDPEDAVVTASQPAAAEAGPRTTEEGEEAAAAAADDAAEGGDAD